MISLAQLYATIEADLAESARIFRDELVSDQPFLRELCRHVDQFHGKRLRPALLLLTASACGGVRREHRVLAAVVEMVHIATLVHDDILDDADVRRRAETVNRMAGNERAVLLGDYLISHAFHLCSSLDSQYASRRIADASNTVCEGEMMQVYNRENLELSEDEYYDIIGRKTASLIAVCCELGAKFAGATERTVRRLHEYGMLIGTAFQIADDLLDLNGDEAEVGKSLGRDVEKGKLTLPLIHYLSSADRAARERMIATLSDGAAARRGDVAQVLTRSGSMDYAAQCAQGRIRQALHILDELPASEARSALVAMTEFILSRRS